MAENAEKRAGLEHGLVGQSIADYLSSAITNGRYVPGQRLVEADLTSELGVGRGTVREAFRKLASEGLIEIVPNRGALVRRLSLTEALELFEIRMELETLAARRAAEHMSDPRDRERFERQIEPIRDESPRLSTAAYICENKRFHDAVMLAAGNAQLEKLNTQLQLSLIMAQISPMLTAAVMRKSLYEHRLIAQAILDGEAVAAGEAVRSHLMRARDLVKAMPADVFRRMG